MVGREFFIRTFQVGRAGPTGSSGGYSFSEPGLSTSATCDTQWMAFAIGSSGRAQVRVNVALDYGDRSRVMAGSAESMGTLRSHSQSNTAPSMVPSPTIAVGEWATLLSKTFIRTATWLEESSAVSDPCFRTLIDTSNKLPALVDLRRASSSAVLPAREGRREKAATLGEPRVSAN